MWALILFLILGCALFFRCVNERVKIADCQKHQDLASNIDKQIILEFSVQSRVEQKFFENRFDALEVVKDELLTIIGDNWRNMFRDCPCYLGEYKSGKKTISLNSLHSGDLSWRGFGNIWCVAYELWLAKQGFLPPGTARKYQLISPIEGYDFSEQVSTDSGSIISNAKIEAQQSNDALRNLTMKICQMIEGNMRRAHPELDLRLTFWKDMHGIEWLRWNFDIQRFDGHLEYLWEV